MVAFPSRVKLAYGDVAALAEIVRPIITPWYSGKIYIFNPADSDVDTDIDAGPSGSSVVLHPYWNGPARIQPTRGVLDSKETTNDTTRRGVLFQTGYAKDGTLPDVRPGHQIIVTNGGNNQLLTQYQYVITGMINSSMAWNNTIFTDVNLEAKPNYSIGAPLYPGEDLFPDEDVFPNG